jgi:hypothetical protein
MSPRSYLQFEEPVALQIFKTPVDRAYLQRKYPCSSGRFDLLGYPADGNYNELVALNLLRQYFGEAGMVSCSVSTKYYDEKTIARTRSYQLHI